MFKTLTPDKLRAKFMNVKRGTVLPANSELWDDFLDDILVKGETEIQTNLNQTTIIGRNSNNKLVWLKGIFNGCYQRSKSNGNWILQMRVKQEGNGKVVAIDTSVNDYGWVFQLGTNVNERGYIKILKPPIRLKNILKELADTKSAREYKTKIKTLV